MKMSSPHQGKLSRLFNGWIDGFAILFGCREASERKKRSAFMSMPTESMKDDGGANLKYVPKQLRCDRAATSTAASTTITTVKASSVTAEVVKPLADTHRRTSSKWRRHWSKSRRRTRAIEEHQSCPSNDDDTGYQRFLDFLNKPSGSPPQDNLGGGTAASNEGHEQVFIEQRGLSTKEENSNANEHLSLSLSISNLSELGETDSLFCAEQGTSTKDVDSAMAWCALAAVLGCQAPSSVTKQAGGKMKQKDNLWETDTGSENMPDLPFDQESCVSVASSLSLREDAPDLNEISFDESDYDDGDSLFIVPDIEEAQDLTCEDMYKKTSVKEAADSTLSWSALAFLLGAPAPASVVKKSRKVVRVSDESSSELIPNV